MTTVHHSSRFVDLAADVAVSAQDLVEAHGEELRAEVREEAQRAYRATIALAAAGGLLAIGVVFALVGIVKLLIEQFGFSAATAWGSVGLVVGLSGAIIARIAVLQLHAVHLVPERSLRSMKDSLVWITRR